MERPLVTVLKLGLVAALMAFVFNRITWRDAVVHSRGEVEVQRIEGRVVGAWQVPDGEPILFQRDDDEAGDPVPVHSGTRADGIEVIVETGFLTYWRNVRIPWFLLGALCYCTSVLFAGTRWWWLLRVNGLPVSLVEAWRLTWIGVFFNNVLPGATGGDLVKALYIVKRSPGRRVPALVSVGVDRILGLASLALLCGLAVLPMLSDFGTIALGVWAVIAAVGLLGVIAFSRRVRSLIRLRHLLDKLPAKVAGVLKLVDEAVFYYRSHKRGIALWLGLGMINHVISVCSVLFMGEALGACLPTARYLIIVPVVNIVSAVPISPNGWGVAEVVYGELFATYGCAGTEVLRRTQGVALSVLYRLHMTLLSLIGGAVILLSRDRVTKEDIQREVALEAREDAEAQQHGAD